MKDFGDAFKTFPGNKFVLGHEKTIYLEILKYKKLVLSARQRKRSSLDLVRATFRIFLQREDTFLTHKSVF